jgi:putative spermidine/putrescine transport system permease protein
MKLAGEHDSFLDRWIIACSLIVVVLLIAPLLVAAVNSLGDGVLAVFPPEHFASDAYRSIPRQWWEAIATSAAVSFAASLIAVMFGTLGAWGLVRGRVRASLRTVVEVILRSPVQVPALVSGVSFMLLYVWLRDRTEWDALANGVGLVVAHAAYTLPFVLAIVGARLASFDTTLEDAAMGLGASRTETFLRVTLPVLWPAIMMGGLFSFLISFDNLPLSLFMVNAGIRLFPVELFNGITFEVTRVIYAVATIVAVATSLIVLATFRYLRSVVVHDNG